MKLGGHETFFPRPGWITKGLLLLALDGAAVFSSIETADALGLGRNMSKSLGWWLVTLGLANRSGRSSPLELTPFGIAVSRFDPWMTRLGTWWLVHATAMTCRPGGVLPWFFAQAPQRFERGDIVAALKAAAADSGARPSDKAVQREVAVVLQAYAEPVPRPPSDPEDNLGCPLRRLSLLRHHTRQADYERVRPTPIPAEALALVVGALCVSQTDAGGRGLERALVDLPLSSREALYAGRLLGLNLTGLAELAEAGETALEKRLQVRNLAGERVITAARASAADWALAHYARVGAQPAGVAEPAS